MKPSYLLLWPASLAIAASTYSQYVRPIFTIVRHMQRQNFNETEGNLLLDILQGNGNGNGNETVQLNGTTTQNNRVRSAPRRTAPLDGRSIHKWNDFSYPVDADEACVIFRSLEWLVFSLIETVQDITAEAATEVYVGAKKQGGALVLIMRSMMIWQSILDKLKVRLEATNVWGVESQLQVAESYVWYSTRSAEFLARLTEQANDFDTANPARCLMYDKIESLLLSYTTVASLLYGEGVQELINGNFPANWADSFETTLGDPTVGNPIREYLSRVDAFDPTSALVLFRENQASWICADDAATP